MVCALFYHLWGMATLPVSFQNSIWHEYAFYLNSALFLTLAFFAYGVSTRLSAFVAWLILAIFFSFHRPAIEIHTSFLSLLLLFCVFVKSPPDMERRETQVFVLALMVLYGISYSMSGVFKYLSPEWMSGNNMKVFFLSAHSEWAKDLLQNLDTPVIRFLAGVVALAETLVLPMILWSRTRRWAIGTMIAMHIAIGVISNFFHVSIGMIACNLFCLPYFSRFRYQVAFQKY